MKRGPVIVLVFVLLAVGIVAASRFMRAQPPLQITVAVSPLAQAWVSSAVNTFNASSPIVNGTRRVVVTVTTMDDLNVWSDEGESPWANAHPTAWIPATKVSLGYADRLTFDVVQPSLAQTVLMWGGFSDRVKVLTGGSHPRDWSDVDRAAVAGTWAGIPGADSSWGNVLLAFKR